MSLLCLNEVQGIPSACQTQNPFTTLKGIVLAVPGFTFDSFTDFANQDKWLEYIKDKKLFPVMEVKEIEPQNVEDGFYDTPDGEKLHLYDGQRGYVLKVKYDLNLHKILRTYSGKNWTIFKIDKANNVMAQTPDGTTVGGFELSLFHVDKQDNNISADTPAYTMMTIQEAIVNEWDVNGLYITPTWLALKLDGVTKVVLTASTISSNAFTLTALYTDNAHLTSAGASNTAALTGRVAADFEIIDQTGAILNPATAYTCTEQSANPGTYDIDATVGAMTSGSASVKPSATNLYESDSVTVVAP